MEEGNHEIRSCGGNYNECLLCQSSQKITETVRLCMGCSDVIELSIKQRRHVGGILYMYVNNEQVKLRKTEKVLCQGYSQSAYFS